MHLPRNLALPLVLLALALSPIAPLHADVVSDIATANGGGKTVFLVVSDGPGPDLELARKTAQEAAALAPGASVLELDRRDPAQAQAVTSYRLAAAPVPLVLVVAKNGVAVGAQRPGEGAAARLVALIPTPRKADYLKHLSEQRVALVAFTRTGMGERDGLVTAANESIRLLEGKAGLVLVDLDDVAEKRFVADMKVDVATTRPVVLVVNPKGQVLGRLEGLQTAAKLVETAKKAAPCCSDPGCKGCK